MYRIALLAAIALLPLSSGAHAGGIATGAAREHARAIAKICPGNWEAQSCLKAVSESTLVLAANYAGTLDAKGKKTEIETLKQHCAAATAATQTEVPAYAMKSALTECANIMSDLVDATGVKPDLSHYQLLVLPVLCLSGSDQCAPAEKQLKDKYGR